MPTNMSNVIDSVKTWPARKKATGLAVIVASVALFLLALAMQVARRPGQAG